MWERSLRWQQDILIDLRDLELRKAFESGDSVLGAVTVSECRERRADSMVGEYCLKGRRVCAKHRRGPVGKMKKNQGGR